MSNIDKLALREAAEKANPGPWRYLKSTPFMDAEISAENHTRVVNLLAGDVTEANSEFIALANPTTVLALLDELEAKDKLIAELTESLKQTVSGYKSCLRTGHDRILDLGGECDAPEVMIVGNPDIRQAEKLRAAMLQGMEPVSNRDELPLDYLQGHKDGLEWAALLAEANHPQTGDWLYDDPVELAKAIRKGPDMPESRRGNSPVIPDGWKLVPIELTGDMTNAMSEAILDDLHNVDVWRSLLAAAPQQEVK